MPPSKSMTRRYKNHLKWNVYSSKVKYSRTSIYVHFCIRTFDLCTVCFLTYYSKYVLEFDIRTSLLERYVHEWTSKWSTSGEREKWTFVKQILMVHGDGPRRCPRMDIAKVHTWTLNKAPSVAPPKKKIMCKKKISVTGGNWTPVCCMEVQYLTN